MNNRGKIISVSVFGSLILFAIFLILFIPEGKSNPDTGVTNCTNLTIAGETYNLTTDILNNQIRSNCINIYSPNIIFNCQGHYISSIQNYSGVYTNATNTTIKNCNITIGSGGNTNANGIYLNGVSSSNSTIFNNSVFGDSYAGIYLSGSNKNNLTNNNATSSLSYGILLVSSNNSLLTNNTGIGGSDTASMGLYLAFSNNNTLTSNTGISNSTSGLYLSSSNNNILTSNTGISNSTYGINIYGSNNILTSNTGISNSNTGTYISAGLYLYKITNTILTLNTGIAKSGQGILVQESILNNSLVSNNGTSPFGVGIELELTNNTLFSSNTGTSNSSMGIYLSHYASNNNLTSNTGISNSSYGIVLQTSSNNILTSNTGTSNVSDGIHLQDSSNNNTFISNTGISNSNPGFYISASSNNNTLISNIGISNSSSGFYLAGSNNTFTSNIGISNFTGFYISTSNNNIINNLITNNCKYGLYISSSNGTIVSNLTAKNNSKYGIFLEGGSQNNVITNSFIQLNNGSAFALNSTGIAPSSNYFYNNYFNNSVQYSNVSTPAVNFFNITKTLGTNIVGGNYLAGNYWAAPNGSGFSQTCTSTTDGICNTAYNFDGINYDYLPLACVENWVCSWGSCTNYIQTCTYTDANLCQTYKLKPLVNGLTQSCGTVDLGGHVAQSSGGGGGGGSSFISPVLNVTPSKPVEITINNSNMDLSSLVLNVKKAVANSSVNITKINSTLYNQLIGLPIGRLYQAFIIEPGISNSNIINATINFRINKTWLAENNITFHYNKEKFWLLEDNIVGNIILYRNPDGANAWLPLTTNYSYQDNESYHFYAYSTGFSTFAIFLNKYDCLPNSARCDNSEVQMCLGNSTWLVTEHCTYGCQGRVCSTGFFQSDQFYTVLVTMILGSIIIVLILLRKKFKGKGIYKPYSKF